MTNAIRLYRTYILSKNVPMNTNRTDGGFLLHKGLDPVQSICRATTRKRPFAVWYAQVDSVSSRSPGWMVMPVS